MMRARFAAPKMFCGGSEAILGMFGGKKGKNREDFLVEMRLKNSCLAVLKLKISISTVKTISC